MFLNKKILLLIGLLQLCSGKECPETARPHKTRCDKFFRCVLLPSKNYVWVPTECEQGLIFEPSLKICVLPGEDWECNLNEEDKTELPDDGTNVYGINNLDLNDESFNEDLSSEKNKFGENSDENPNYEYIEDDLESKEDEEFSGDGYIQIEEKEIPTQKMAASDKQIATHLQRLTQLIDSLRNKEENSTENLDLVPDQLNSFLANHNIKSQFDQIDFSTEGKIPVPKDGVIHQQHLNEILAQQAKLSTTTMKSTTTKPPSRIIIKNRKPTKNYRLPDGTYTSSQIVVNRPGGSVLFSIPSRDRNDQQQTNKQPYMSDETLRTVLELSKQLISSNHQSYLQPIVNPVYYTIPVPVPSESNEEKKDVKAYINNSPITDPPLTIKDSFNTFYPAPPRSHSVPSNNISTTIYMENSKDDEPNEKSTSSSKYSEQASNSYGTKATLQNDDLFSHQNRYENQNQYYSQYYPPFQQNFPIQTFQNQKLTKQPQNSQQFNYPQNNNQHLNNENINDAINFNSNFYPINYNPNLPMNGNGYYQNMNQNSDHQSYYQNQKMQFSQNSMNNGQMMDEAYDEEVEEEEKDEPVMTTQLEPMMSVKKQRPVVEISYNGDSIDTESEEDNEKKLVNVGGSFVNYDEYKKSIIPLIVGQRISQNNLEVVSCNSGMRQPNKVDCSKYYVCNPKTKNIISYSCPAYTAFNGETRICDARTYSVCNPQPQETQLFTIKGNKNKQMQQIKAWEENNNKISTDSMNSQNLANLIRLETQKLLSDSNTQKKPIVKKTIKRRRYRCNEPGKIPDVTSNVNYYVCFRGQDNLMRRQKMVCMKGLVFCRKTLLCTLPKKCV